MADVFLILFVVLFPVVLLYLKEHIAFMAKWSTLIVCYIVGLLIGNIGILPQSATGLLDTLSSVAVAISIPLLLFQWISRSGKIVGQRNPGVRPRRPLRERGQRHRIRILQNNKLRILQGRRHARRALHRRHTEPCRHKDGAQCRPGRLPGGAHLGYRALGSLSARGDEHRQADSQTRPAPQNWDSDVASSTSLNFTMGFSDYFKKGLWKKILAGFGLAAAIVGVSQGLSMLVPVEFQTMVTILLITSLALAASFVPTIRALPMTFATGEYFLYVFAVAVGAMGNIAQIFNNAGIYFIYVAIVLFGSLLLHAGLCALFKIDVDTMLIVSVSAICSPPFVGLAAVSLKARKLILPGITTGIIGYAVGNYLGIALAQILRALGG